jgi:hypothetical protein
MVLLSVCLLQKVVVVGMRNGNGLLAEKAPPEPGVQLSANGQELGRQNSFLKRKERKGKRKTRFLK